MIFHRRAEVTAETFAGAHPSGWRRHLPFTGSWVTTGPCTVGGFVFYRILVIRLLWNFNPPTPSKNGVSADDVFVTH